MSRIIAIANQKGGVGKTTTSINLGIGLSRAGKRVCLVDLDPQGNATQGLGYDPDELDCSITTIMDKIIDKDFNSSQDFGILHHAEGIDLVPSSIELAVMEMKLLSVYIGREKILNTYLEMIKTQYDYIIIDSAPVGMVSDTFALVRVADATVYVTRANYTTTKEIELLNKLYATKRLPKLSVVLNGTKAAAGYGYGYGEKSGK